MTAGKDTAAPLASQSPRGGIASENYSSEVSRSNESVGIEQIRQRRAAIDGAPWKYENAGQTVFGYSPGGCNKTPCDYMVANIRGWGHLQYMGKTRGDAKAQAMQDANGEFIGHAPEDVDTLLAEIDRLRLIEATARELIGPDGVRLTLSNTHRLTVVEKADKTDPHYRLCVLLEEQRAPRAIIDAVGGAK